MPKKVRALPMTDAATLPHFDCPLCMDLQPKSHSLRRGPPYCFLICHTPLPFLHAVGVQTLRLSFRDSDERYFSAHLVANLVGTVNRDGPFDDHGVSVPLLFQSSDSPSFFVSRAVCAA